jgi:hypothetical protein
MRSKNTSCERTVLYVFLITQKYKFVFLKTRKYYIVLSPENTNFREYSFVFSPTRKYTLYFYPKIQTAENTNLYF